MSGDEKEEKKMLLFLDTKRPNGKGNHMKVECVADSNGILLFVTGRRIIKFINEELKRTEAESMGVPYDPDIEEEFKPYRSWHVGTKDDE